MFIRQTHFKTCLLHKLFNRTYIIITQMTNYSIEFVNDIRGIIFIDWSS